MRISDWSSDVCSSDLQLRGFGDGHEIARDVAVRESDRAAGQDLLVEQRHHAARAAQHVAEAHHREAGGGADLGTRSEERRVGERVWQDVEISGVAGSLKKKKLEKLIKVTIV